LPGAAEYRIDMQRQQQQQLFVVFAFLSVASAHLCLLYPLQRGSVRNLSVVGTPDCGLTNGPCGGRNASRPLGIVQYGPDVNDTVHLLWQKNEDHWYSAAPGNFTFFVIDRESNTHLIGSLPDTNAPSGTVYEHEFSVPSPHPPGIMVVVQGIYYTNNPNVGNAVFYQCADAVLQF